MSNRVITQQRIACDVGKCTKEALRDEKEHVASCQWCRHDVCAEHGRRMLLEWSPLDDTEDRTRIDTALVCTDCANRVRRAIRDAWKAAR